MLHFLYQIAPSCTTSPANLPASNGNDKTLSWHEGKCPGDTCTYKNIPMPSRWKIRFNLTPPQCPKIKCPRNPETLLQDASSMHPDLRLYMDRVIVEKKYPEQAYRSCRGIMSLARKDPDGYHWGQIREKTIVFVFNLIVLVDCLWKCLLNLVFSGLFKGATFTPDSRGSLSSDSPRRGRAHCITHRIKIERPKATWRSNKDVLCRNIAV